MNTQTLQTFVLVLIFAAVAKAVDCDQYYNDCLSGGGGTYGCGIEKDLCESGQY